MSKVLPKVVQMWRGKKTLLSLVVPVVEPELPAAAAPAAGVVVVVFVAFVPGGIRV